MSTATVIIPDKRVQLTIEQIINAACQLEYEERQQLAQALAMTQLNTELSQLIADLYSEPPVNDISDEDIMAEIRTMRLSAY